jgi:hypothetical protein
MKHTHSRFKKTKSLTHTKLVTGPFLMQKYNQKAGKISFLIYFLPHFPGELDWAVSTRYAKTQLAPRGDHVTVQLTVLRRTWLVKTSRHHVTTQHVWTMNEICHLTVWTTADETWIHMTRLVESYFCDYQWWCSAEAMGTTENNSKARPIL